MKPGLHTVTRLVAEASEGLLCCSAQSYKTPYRNLTPAAARPSKYSVISGGGAGWEVPHMFISNWSALLTPQKASMVHFRDSYAIEVSHLCFCFLCLLRYLSQWFWPMTSWQPCLVSVTCLIFRFSLPGTVYLRNQVTIIDLSHAWFGACWVWDSCS